MTVYHGAFAGSGRHFGIVVARFNEFITRRLLDSTLLTFEQAGVNCDDVEVVWVPGALEVPLFCQKLARSGKYDGIIAIACVLRGGTYHYECVCDELTRGVSQVALEKEIPVTTAIITADTLEQAIDRAGLKSGNKGAQAAMAALETANLFRQLSEPIKQKETRAAGGRSKTPRKRARKKHYAKKNPGT